MILAISIWIVIWEKENWRKGALGASEVLIGMSPAVLSCPNYYEVGKEGLSLCHNLLIMSHNRGMCARKEFEVSKIQSNERVAFL